MNHHLTDEQLLALAGLPGGDDALDITAPAAHLQTCAECRVAVAAYRRLFAEFSVTRRSTPAEESMHRYYALAAEIERTAGPLQDIANRIKAVLQADSRLQSPLLGRRGAGQSAYRLLYATPAAQIELMIDPVPGEIIIEGDLIPQTAAVIAPALVQLSRAADQSPVVEVETDGNGRFRLASIAPGDYTLSIIDAGGRESSIDPLSLP